MSQLKSDANAFKPQLRTTVGEEDDYATWAVVSMTDILSWGTRLTLKKLPI